MDSIARYWLRIAFFAYRLFDAPVNLVWKNRMMRLPDGEQVLKICLFVSTEYKNVTDGQTDTTRRHRPRLCKASRDKKCAVYYLLHSRNAGLENAGKGCNTGKIENARNLISLAAIFQFNDFPVFSFQSLPSNIKLTL